MGPTVLIADDDTDIRLTLRTLLEDEGFTVLESATGIETLRILRDITEPLIVLVDLLMGENGGNVLGVVTRDPVLSQRHRFILLTAMDPPRIPADVLSYGYPLVKKPFDIDDIMVIVRQVAE